MAIAGSKSFSTMNS